MVVRWGCDADLAVSGFWQGGNLGNNPSMRNSQWRQLVYTMD